MSNQKVLFKFYWDCGRAGELLGLFVATREQLEASYGKFVYFGEVLGKHSEISGTLDRDDVIFISEDSTFVNKFAEAIGEFGYNPLSYIQED